MAVSKNTMTDAELEQKFPYVYRLLLQNKYGMAIFNTDLVILAANQKYLEAFDKPFNTIESSIGQSLYKIVKGFKGSLAEKNWIKMVETGEIFEYKEFMTNQLEKGITYWDTSFVPILENDKVKYIIQNSVEVTDKVLCRKREEEKTRLIEQQNRQLEAIFENMSTGLTIIDETGKYVRMNKAFQELFKSIKHEEIGSSFEQCKYYDGSGNELAKDDLTASKVLKGENIKNRVQKMKIGEKETYFEVSGIPVFDESGNFEKGVITYNDITGLMNQAKIVEDQKRQFENEQKIRLNAEYDKNKVLEKVIEMKNDFFTLITHEFKTPITVINSATQALEYFCKDELSDRAKGYINKIKRNSLRQLKLANNILDITRMDSDHFNIHKTNKDIVILTRAIIESVNLYAELKKIVLTFDTAFKQKIIGIDEEKYERILLNLLSNAIKFTPEHKCVTVKLSSKNGWVYIKVQDEGIGIPKENLALIFERFGQVDSSLSRQAEGSGIGLSLVKLFVEALGGMIKVSSSVGKGSTFTVMLPADNVSEERVENTFKIIASDRPVLAAEIEFSDLYI